MFHGSTLDFWKSQLAAVVVLALMTGNHWPIAILQLAQAIMELTNWVEEQGAVEVSDNVCNALVAIDRNEEFTKTTLAMLMTQE